MINLLKTRRPPRAGGGSGRLPVSALGLVLVLLASACRQPAVAFDPIVAIDSVGKAVDLGRRGPKVLVLNFFSPTCEPCLRELPALVWLRDQIKKYPGREMDFYLVMYPEEGYPVLKNQAVRSQIQKGLNKVWPGDARAPLLFLKPPTPSIAPDALVTGTPETLVLLRDKKAGRDDGNQGAVYRLARNFFSTVEGPGINGWREQKGRDNMSIGRAFLKIKGIKSGGPDFDPGVFAGEEFRKFKSDRLMEWAARELRERNALPAESPHRFEKDYRLNRIRSLLKDIHHQYVERKNRRLAL